MYQNQAPSYYVYGWHLPSDEEWKVLKGTVDSQYGGSDPEWEKNKLPGLRCIRD